MSAEKEILKNRIRDLAETAASRNTYTHSFFLTPPEQSVYLSIKNELPVSSALYGGWGNEARIRALVCFGSSEEFGYEWESPIRVLHIYPRNEKFAQECTHRDYLGSLMALGLERKVTGDIVVRQKEAWVFVLETAAAFIAENLCQVRHTDVICEPAKGEVPELAPVFESFTSNIASERLDLMIGAAAGLKRERAKKLLESEKVFVNGRLAERAGTKLSAGDELVIRGFGKFIFDGIEATTRKDRLIVSFRKYC